MLVRWYDAMVEALPASFEVGRDVEFIASLAPRSVADLAAGTGRLSLGLDGVERRLLVDESADALAVAMKRAPGDGSTLCCVGNMAAAGAPWAREHSVDVVVCGAGSICHLLEEEHLEEFFRNVSALLALSSSAAVVTRLGVDEFGPPPEHGASGFHVRTLDATAAGDDGEILRVAFEVKEEKTGHVETETWTMRKWTAKQVVRAAQSTGRLRVKAAYSRFASAAASDDHDDEKNKVFVFERAWEGGCHCGGVRWRVVLPFDDDGRLGAVLCNCSICSKKGNFLHCFVRPDAFELLTDEANLSEYRFNTRTARHLFCRKCGVHSHYVARSHPNDWDVDLNSLDEAEDVLQFVRVKKLDGKNNWEGAVHEIQ